MSKRERFLLSAMMLFLVAFLGCSSGPTNPNLARSTLSGEWSGTQTIIKDGQCTIAGGNSASYPVTLIWTVDNAGGITIRDPMEPTHRWGGKVETNLNISLQKVYPITCFGTPRIATTVYNGTVRRASGTYKLDMESVEEWCPVQGCIFRVRYSVQKVIG